MPGFGTGCLWCLRCRLGLGLGCIRYLRCDLVVGLGCIWYRWCSQGPGHLRCCLGLWCLSCLRYLHRWTYASTWRWRRGGMNKRTSPAATGRIRRMRDMNPETWRCLCHNLSRGRRSLGCLAIFPPNRSMLCNPTVFQPELSISHNFCKRKKQKLHNDSCSNKGSISWRLISDMHLQLLCTRWKFLEMYLRKFLQLSQRQWRLGGSEDLKKTTLIVKTIYVKCSTVVVS